MKSNLSTSLEKALPIVASAYGQQFGVRVMIGGSSAYTDGQTITLPIVKCLDIHDVLFGYLAHESGHIRSSDFSLMRRIDNKVGRHMLNAIEDVRIEKEMMHFFPGTKITIKALYQYVSDNALIQVINSEDNPGTQLVLYVLYKCKVEYMGFTLFEPLLRLAEPIIRDTFGQSFMQALDQIMSTNMPHMSCCGDAFKISTQIMSLLDVDPDKSNPQDDSSDSDGSDSQDDSSDSDGSDSQDDSSGSDGSDSQDDSSGPDGSDSQDDSSDSDGSDSQDDSSGSDKSGTSTSITSLRDVLTETDLPKEVTEVFREHISSDQIDDSHHGMKLDATSVGTEYRRIRSGDGFNESLLNSSRLRSRLTGLLQAKNRNTTWLHQKGKRVSGNRLARVSTGDQRVFLHRDIKKSLDTSVHLLIDSSGSMRGRQQVANSAALTLSLAIQGIRNCDIAVSVFPGIGSSVSPVLTRKKQIRCSIDRFNIVPSGTTPLAEAMLYAARELSESNRERKVLIIVTDGEPNVPGAVTYINSLLEGHVDTYAIGIHSESVFDHFRNSVVIKDVNDLQTKLFELTKSFLLAA